jgi:hypothetical protein
VNQAQAYEKSGERLNADERTELHYLRREVKTLCIEKEILKKQVASKHKK